MNELQKKKCEKPQKKRPHAGQDQVLRRSRKRLAVAVPVTDWHGREQKENQQKIKNKTPPVNINYGPSMEFIGRNSAASPAKIRVSGVKRIRPMRNYSSLSKKNKTK